MPKTPIPILYGAPYSVYVRAVRLTLEEKGVPYELVPIDIFASEGVPSEHKARHPFGNSPPSSAPGFRCMKPARSHVMWMRPFPVLGSSRMTPMAAPE